MPDQFQIVRKIEIDAAHRVPLHGSRCKGLHGHRYLIEAVVTGPLVDGGQEDGMVIDFGFLKEEMVNTIDQDCDHGLILQYTDPIIRVCFPEGAVLALSDALEYHLYEPIFLEKQGSMALLGKLYLIRDVPTAENLARHWFLRLSPKIALRSAGHAHLHQLIVHETPQCRAAYPMDAVLR